MTVRFSNISDYVYPSVGMGKHQGISYRRTFEVSGEIVCTIVVEYWEDIDYLLVHDIRVSHAWQRKGIASEAVLRVSAELAKRIVPVQIRSSSQGFWAELANRHPSVFDGRQLGKEDYATLIDSTVDGKSLVESLH